MKAREGKQESLDLYSGGEEEATEHGVVKALHHVNIFYINIDL